MCALRAMDLFVARAQWHHFWKHHPRMDVRVNGTVLPNQSGVDRFELVLKGIALSNSPVLVRAEAREQRSNIALRIHLAGRRRELRMHDCATQAEAAELMIAVLRGSADDSVAGTWALHGVSGWSPEQQRALAAVLALLDEHRLEQRLPHELIPRVIVLETSAGGHLEPELERRLGFFEIDVGIAPQPAKKSRRKN